MEPGRERWPLPWRLEFVWQRVTIALFLAATLNLVLAIVGVDAARDSSAVISIVILAGLVVRLSEWISRNDAPRPRRRALPAATQVVEFGLIGVVTALWVGVGLVARRAAGDATALETALGIAAIGVPLLLLTVRPRGDYETFRDAEQQDDDDGEVPATGRAVAGLLVAAVVLPGAWWLLVEYVYGGDEFDRVLVPVAIAVGFAAWALVKNQDRLDERRAERTRQAAEPSLD